LGEIKQAWSQANEEISAAWAAADVLGCWSKTKHTDNNEDGLVICLGSRYGKRKGMLCENGITLQEHTYQGGKLLGVSSSVVLLGLGVRR
jgi:hypothetical protein